MTNPNRAQQMHINLFLAGVGHHEAAWRLPGSRPHSLFELEHYRHAARVAEAGKLDSIFFADTLSTGVNVKRNLMTAMEPTNLLAALAPAFSCRMARTRSP